VTQWAHLMESCEDAGKDELVKFVQSRHLGLPPFFAFITPLTLKDFRGDFEAISF
jgi:hypothetical protein